MSKHILLFLSVLTLSFVIGLSVQAEDPEAIEHEAPEDGLVIDFMPGNGKRDLSVEFNHSSHESYDCQTCHHKMFQLRPTQEPRSCSECHTKFDANDLKGYRSYFKAMHKVRFAPQSSRPSCLDCHMREFGEDDQEMVGCSTSACHPDGIQ